MEGGVCFPALQDTGNKEGRLACPTYAASLSLAYTDYPFYS